MKRNLLLCLISLLSTWTIAQESEFQERDYHHKNLSPTKGVLMAVGQFQMMEYVNYCKVIPDGSEPNVVMFYTGLNHPHLDRKVLEWKQKTDFFSWGIAAQIGLSMTKDGAPEKHYEDKVAMGEYKEQIQTLISSLKEWGIPVYLRIGYEFNGEWNGYEPATYVKAFQRIKYEIDRQKATNIATVWCYSADAKDKDFMRYFPGDEAVDWWGIDLFDAEHFDAEDTKAFMQQAKEHEVPVMIGEATPRKIDLSNSEQAWSSWFEPYFGFIYHYPQVKMASYINADWSSTFLPDWGNARLEQHPHIQELWNNEIEKPLFMYGETQAVFQEMLYWEEE